MTIATMAELYRAGMSCQEIADRILATEGVTVHRQTVQDHLQAHGVRIRSRGAARLLARAKGKSWRKFRFTMPREGA